MVPSVTVSPSLGIVMSCTTPVGTPTSGSAPAVPSEPPMVGLAESLSAGPPAAATECAAEGSRSAPAGAAAAIARVHMASRAATMPYLPPQKRGHDQVTRWVEDVLLTTCRMWVAERDTEILGYAALEGDMLEHLYLRPDVRRQGIGTLLLDEVRRHSPDGLSLHVFEQNTEARAFYERHGFTVLDTSDGSRNMENLPDMTLRWTPDDSAR
jgi:GNAT superfamily N-acetyltransferase